MTPFSMYSVLVAGSSSDVLFSAKKKRNQKKKNPPPTRVISNKNKGMGLLPPSQFSLVSRFSKAATRYVFFIFFNLVGSLRGVKTSRSPGRSVAQP